MFKTLNTGWLKLALLRVFQSGWTVVILVGLSLLFCSFTGRQAFIVWWLTFSGVLLIGASVWLGNLPYRLLQPGSSARRWSGVLSWIIWGQVSCCWPSRPRMQKTRGSCCLIR